MDENLKNHISNTFDSALERGYIQVYYQPVIRTISGKLCSFEALSRWTDPEVGSIRPDQFIPVLEDEKQIHRLDSHVIREVCRRIRRTIDSGDVPVPVSVNLSRLDFTLCDIFAVVDKHVSDFKIPHDFLYIEITESMLGEHGDLMHTVVERFHDVGYQVWMDDFGSGYSSLNMLKEYTFEELKLDMCFLKSFDQRCRRIMTSMIQMAKDIDIHTLAEGVETKEQYIYLRNVGCEKVQGYYFGRPMPYEDAIANLHKKNIRIERPRDRKYYDELGRVNFLSSSPFLSATERRKDITGRHLNSIPLALIEMRKDSFSVLFCNSAFEENANSTVLLPDIFRSDQFGISHPYSMIPGRIINLFEDTRQTGHGRMLFVSNEEYYELTTKCIARRKGAYSVLLQLNNLSEASQSDATSVLDEGLRQLYSIFERISLLDLSSNRFVPLYTEVKSDIADSKHMSLSDVEKVVSEQIIFRDDKEAFLRFWDADTLEDRLENSGRGCLSEFFRCIVNNGRFEWKQFIIIRYKPGQMIELVRSAHTEIDNFTVNSAFTDHSSDPVTPELLWQNLLHTDVIRIFWKDQDRRFLGVNQGFLDYYGFKSDKELIGKNDEEMGWHVHPDLYMNDEYRVINDGITVYNSLGNCISNGMNREILASKTPLRNLEGDIIGMLGTFNDRDPLAVSFYTGSADIYRDELTGLLNARGLREQAMAFSDEYFLRNTDFMLLHISIDEMSNINKQYGEEFGDKLIIELGNHIKNAFGTSASVARIHGYQFLLLHQIYDKGELNEIHDIVRGVASEIKEIDGTPITLYLSMGYSLYSESFDLDLMAQSAEMRLLVDHDDHSQTENRQSGSTDVFRLYDDLPISFAVYKVHTDRNRNVKDAEIIYANHLFERRSGRTLDQMIGHSVRDLFPQLDEKWYDIAGRAALNGETVIDNLYFAENEMKYYITATQIIRPGFCSFTYQETDADGKPKMM